MKLTAYAITTWVGIVLAIIAAEYPSMITATKIGVVAVAMIFAGALGANSQKGEEE